MNQSRVSTLNEIAESLRGGQVWEQPGFPNFSCMLVYIGEEQWCRITPPTEGAGSIAWTDPEGGGPIYTTKALAAVLERHRYRLA